MNNADARRVPVPEGSIHLRAKSFSGKSSLSCVGHFQPLRRRVALRNGMHSPPQDEMPSQALKDAAAQELARESRWACTAVQARCPSADETRSRWWRKTSVYATAGFRRTCATTYLEASSHDAQGPSRGPPVGVARHIRGSDPRSASRLRRDGAARCRRTRSCPGGRRCGAAASRMAGLPSGSDDVTSSQTSLRRQRRTSVLGHARPGASRLALPAFANPTRFRGC